MPSPSSSSEVHIVAYLTPAPGKTSRIEELLGGMIHNVWEKEPTTSRYYLHRQVREENPEIVMVETYDSQSDADAHLQTPYFKDFAKQMQDEGLLSAPPKIIQCVAVKGFESRAQGALVGMEK